MVQRAVLQLVQRNLNLTTQHTHGTSKRQHQQTVQGNVVWAPAEPRGLELNKTLICARNLQLLLQVAGTDENSLQEPSVSEDTDSGALHPFRQPS